MGMIIYQVDMGHIILIWLKSLILAVIVMS